MLGRFGATSPSALASLDRWHGAVCSRAGHLDTFEHALRALKPDVVFCTHQRASRAVPGMLAARRLGIPTATFIYSWDNLPKGRMAVSADRFLVWSESMKQELLGYYPELDPGHVHVVGTPQFEAYFTAGAIEPRESFLARLSLDPTRPVVCFSGCDAATSPHDPVYLDDLATALATMPLHERPQIVFRRCPVDTSGRYQPVLARHPEIVVSEPLWRDTGSDWTGVVPRPEDAVLLANLVHHCDLVVNLGSTMAMDFAIAGRPAAFVAYEPVPVRPGAEWTAREIYRLPHFRSVHELQPVHWVRTREDLAAVVRHILAHPDEKRAARDAWVAHHVQAPFDRASRRCYDALRTIAERSLHECASAS